jgi:hypothetical protein
MQRMATAENREYAGSESRLPMPRQAQRLPVERSRWFRWLYAARPSLMPTVYVPGPVSVARKV